MRTIWTVTGVDRLDFLQNLVTNNVASLTTDGIVWTAILTPQGKYLADFFVIRQGDALLIDIDAGIAEATLRRLTMYRLRADVQIAPSDVQVRRGVEDAPDGAFPDPRHPAMGWRSYGSEPDTSTVDWNALRVEHVVPETGIELTPDTFILEAGFERLHGVDFRKGCYVGQEVTARMKHKTELRKGLLGVRIEGEAPVGTPILSGDRVAGTLFTQSGGRAIASLRFDRTDDLVAGTAKIIVNQ
ncbi:CAF17-like 4Fe-4S cluster assembly/insertion protein YgfZ [Falsirhodobacter sp. 20TX0035]|uniref:CAF17-like 4Fe-4S cluster assembly/insertion protein YgfZ n=1 Tax=Falsirhodobacter sp. 20TX0035 TaxID=3022019 RepID=UPI00232A7A90|nr:folate-binding protein [Falsirhodobacter sp. 20TX0035]MDB6453543.1 folate-binding protein [Falsirhodobacter sp. 20TX0035]